MTIQTDILKQVEQHLVKRQYRQSTIDAYMMWMAQLTDYFSDVIPSQISINQINQFLTFLFSRKKLSTNSVHQAAHTYITIYNELFGKKYKIDDLKLPVREYELQEVLNPDEVIDLLNNAPSLKAKFAFAVLYSAGLLVSELKQIRLIDFDLSNRRISIRNQSGHIVRKAVLSEYVAKEFNGYKKEYKPKKWLFEGKQSGEQMSPDVIWKAFKKTAPLVGITKSVSPRTLKYSYVHHLAEQGIPLHSILKELKMSLSSRTYDFYSKIITGSAKIEVNHSPLDKIIYSNEGKFINTKPLEKLLFRLQDEKEADYLSEAIKCLRVGAYRACVVFAWNAAVRNIHNRLILHSKHSLNAAITKHEPKARQIKTIADFSYVKEQTILLASVDLGEFDKNQKDMLETCLTLRNKCVHPGNYKPQPFKAASFLEDLITIVFQ